MANDVRIKISIGRRDLICEALLPNIFCTLISSVLESITGDGDSTFWRHTGENDDSLLNVRDVKNSTFDVGSIQNFEKRLVVGFLTLFGLFRILCDASNVTYNILFLLYFKGWHPCAVRLNLMDDHITHFQLISGA